MRSSISLVGLCAGLACAGSVFAQATVKADGQWRSVLGLGASLSKGNTDSTNVNLAGDGVRATAQDKTSVYGNANFARSGGVTSGEQMRLAGTTTSI